jgi:hypothetical protein
MNKPQSVTSLEVSPEAERRGRMIKYTAAMSIRVVCIILAVMVQGWLMWVFFAGAIFLPYFAVVIANAVGSSQTSGLARAIAPTRTLNVGNYDNSTTDK